MILHLWRFRWFCLHIILGQYIRADWSSSTFSNILLLGLFPDVSNSSQPSTMSLQSRAMFKAAILLSQQYNITIEGQFIGWQSVQTGGDVMTAFRSSCIVMSTSNIVGIVGPAFSRESIVIALFAKSVGIPVISYSATDLELSDRNTYSTFYRTVPSDNAAALAITKLFIRFNWTSCIIIYQNDIFGSDGSKAINEAFNNSDLIVTDMIVFDIATLRLRSNLRRVLTSSSSRIVLVWATPDNTALILQNALVSDVIGPQFKWILSSNVPLNSFNQTWYNKLIGMLTIEPVVGNIVNAPINTTLLNEAYTIWQQYEPESFPGPDNVNNYALFAFDATWTLIQSLKEFCSLSSSCISFINTSFCFDRKFLHSNLLFDIINNSSFLGVSGFVKFSPYVTDRINGTYYIVKNVQYFSNSLNYVPVLIWSDSDGYWTPHLETNVIVWPDNSLIIPNSYAAMSGMTFRIAVIESAPYTMVTQTQDISGQTTTKLIGYMPDLIGLLQAQMGFIPNIILVPSNQTYNGLVDAVANGVYDMVVADLTITAARSEKVAFSRSIFDNSLRIIIRETAVTTSIDFLSYLRPLSFKVWITLLMATIFAGLLICLLERQENELLRDRSISSLIALCMWYSIGTLFGYGADFHVTTAAGRLLTIGLYILSLILVAAYTANLASDLTILKLKYSISGIDDIKTGKISFNRIGIVIDTSIEDYYLQEISHGIRNFYPLKDDSDIFVNLLNNTIDVSIMDTGLLEYLTNNIYCNLTLVGADFDQSLFGIAFQKKWPFAQYLDVTILSLRESNALDDLTRKWFQTDFCSGSSQTSTAMKIESMAGLFLTFIIISIVAVLLYAWQKRFIIKKYLVILIHLKKLLAKQNIFKRKKSDEISSENPSTSKLSSSPIMYL